MISQEKMQDKLIPDSEANISSIGTEIAHLQIMTINDKEDELIFNEKENQFLLPAYVKVRQDWDLM